MYLKKTLDPSIPSLKFKINLSLDFTINHKGNCI